MGSNIWELNSTPANNSTIGGIDATGGASVANFDNILRSMAAMLKKYSLDMSGKNMVGGTSDAITIASAQTLTTLVDGLLMGFKATAANTTTMPTLNLDTLGAKKIVKIEDGSETALAAGDIDNGGYYLLRYNAALDGGSGAYELVDENADPPSTTYLANLVEDITPQLGGVLDTNSKQVRWSKGADIASAATLTLGDDGNFFDVTGTTTITAIATKGIGTVVVLQFDGALTLTHHTTDLKLPGGENITTAAGDIGIFVEYAAGDWHCLSYTVAAATPGGSSYAESTPAAFSNNSNVSWAHGLGSVPSQFGVWLEVVTAYGDYVVGDRIRPGGGTSVGVETSADDTSVYMSFKRSSAYFVAITQAGSSTTSMPIANLKAVLWAIA